MLVGSDRGRRGAHHRWSSIVRGALLGVLVSTVEPRRLTANGLERASDPHGRSGAEVIHCKAAGDGFDDLAPPGSAFVVIEHCPFQSSCPDHFVEGIRYRLQLRGINAEPLLQALPGIVAGKVVMFRIDRSGNGRRGVSLTNPINRLTQQVP